MKYGFVTVKVNNMEESLKFYTEVTKLSVIAKFNSQPGVTIAFLKDEDNNKVELIENLNVPKVEQAGSKVSIGFKVDCLEEILKVIEERNIEIAMGPMSIPSGEKFVYVKDPNGVEVEFIEGLNI